MGAQGMTYKGESSSLAPGFFLSASGLLEVSSFPLHQTLSTCVPLSSGRWVLCLYIRKVAEMTTYNALKRTEINNRKEYIHKRTPHCSPFFPTFWNFISHYISSLALKIWMELVFSVILIFRLHSNDVNGLNTMLTLECSIFWKSFL